MKQINTIITFWREDYINKVIIFLTLLLVLGVGVISFMITRMPKDSLFYYYLDQPKETEEVIRTPEPILTATNKPISIPQTSATSQPANVTPTIPTETKTATSTPTSITEPDISEPITCIPDNPRTLARVIEVLDGNTVRAYFDGKVFVVRYIGIEVPEEKDVYGKAAFWKNTELVYAEDVYLVPGAADKDSRGRLLRYVLIDETFVNYELIRQGLASIITTETEFACADVFRKVQEQAMMERIGMWVNSGTTP